MKEQKNRYRFYILIDSSRKISVGKLMVHVGHLCTQMAWYYLYREDRPDLLKSFTEWYSNSNQTKIILKVKDLEELRGFWSKIRLQHAFMTFEVADMGFTEEIKKGIIFMMGIEPIQKSDAIMLGLDKLKLYK